VQVRHLRVGLKVAYWCNSPCGGADMFRATVVAVHPRTVTIEYLDHLAGPPVVFRENGRKVLVPPPPKLVRRRVFSGSRITTTRPGARAVADDKS